MDGKAKICLSDLTLERLTAYIVGLGQPKFRARQIFKWLHQKLVTDFSQKMCIRDRSNTIGSKCQDVAITRLVVELKSEIEKIREQIQNIE